MEEEIELHSYTVVAEFEITACSEEEAEEFFMDGSLITVHDIEDNGPV